MAQFLSFGEKIAAESPALDWVRDDGCGRRGKRDRINSN